MAVLASDIITQARLQLIDTGPLPRWTDTELLGYISDAQRTMVAISPGLTSTRLVFATTPGARQTLPADGYTLLDVIRNMGVDGTTPGRAVRIVPRDLLDGFNPLWSAAQASPTAQNFMYDPAENKVFHLYPPADGNGKLEILYSAVPDAITVGTDSLSVPDLYQTAVLYYVLFRAHSKDGDFAAGQSLAQPWLNMFNMFMGVGRTSDLSESPNQKMAPPDLATRGAAS
jgi:hypothetical protein